MANARKHSEDLGWPAPGDSLFAAAGEWKMLAALSKYPDFLTYAGSYKDAADAVLETIELQRRGADSMVYAVMFLYRHYVELMLKGLIQLGESLDGTRAEYPKIHNIERLWNKCRPLIERAFPDGDTAAVEAVDHCMKEMAAMDPDAEAFRFPDNIRGKPTKHTKPLLGLRNVRNVMEKIAGLLDGSYDCMSEELQCRYEELQGDDR